MRLETQQFKSFYNTEALITKKLYISLKENKSLVRNKSELPISTALEQTVPLIPINCNSW